MSRLSKKTVFRKKTIPFFLLVLFILLTALFIKTSPQIFKGTPDLNPNSDTADFVKKLKISLEQASLPLLGEIKIYQSRKIVIFHTKDNVRVIFSLQKDPYFQVTSLQQIFKTAKMDTRQIEKVDLSLKKPYATFKDN